MSADRGTIVEVSTTTLGDELLADAAAGALTLAVVDTADFTEDGGSITIGAEVIDYDTIDDEAATITLATPLVGAYVAGERVNVYPETLDKTALVMVGDSDEAVEATVTHALWDRIADGIRDDGAGEVVDLELVGTDYEVANVVSAPVVDGAFIDPATIPEPAGLDQLQLDLAQLDTDLHGPGGLDDQLAGLNTDLHGTGGLDEQLAGLDTALHGPGGVDEKLTGLDTELGQVLPITSDKLADDAVIAAKIAAGAVGVTEIADGAVANAKLVDGAVNAAKVAAGAITETKITDDAITTPKIAAGAVTASEVAAGAIVAGKIAAGAVTATELAAGSVVAGKVAAGAITATELAAGSVITAKLAAGAVTANEVAANAVTANAIAANAVVAGKIATDAVTANAIAAGAIVAGKIAADAVTANSIAAGAVTASELAADAVTANAIAAGAVVAGKVGADAITTNELSASAVTANELAAGAVVAGKIAANAVTANEIAAGAITTAKLAAGAVTANELSATAIDSKTVTGAYYRTKSSGTRVELGINPGDVTSTSDELRFYYSTQTVPAGRIYGVGLSSVRYETKDTTGEHRFLGGITSDHRVNVDGGMTVGRTSTPPPAGQIINKVKFGTVSSGTLGSLSRYTVTHNLGVNPAYIGISSARGGWWQWYIVSRDATTFVVEFRDQTGALQNGTQGRFDWMVADWS